MKTYTTINGRNFEICKGIDKASGIDRINRNIGRTVDDCYNRPSEFKKMVERDWYNWLAGADNVGCMGVESYNCMMFTLTAHYTAKDGSTYLIYITRDHNRIIPLI